MAKLIINAELICGYHKKILHIIKHIVILQQIIVSRIEISCLLSVYLLSIVRNATINFTLFTTC